MSLTDKDYIYAGNTYSDTLPTGVDDGYDAVLYAGVTYSVVLDSASTPLVYAVAGPQGIVAHGTIYSGQGFTYTPTVSGLYALALGTELGGPGDFTFTAGESGTPTGVDRGAISLGNSYSDYLAPFQLDDYSGYLTANVKYSLTVNSSSIPIDYAVAGPQGVVQSGVVDSGGTVSYTPSVSGLYSLGIGGYAGWAGSYTISLGALGDPTTQSTTSGSPPTATSGSPPVATTTPAPAPQPTFTGEDLTTGKPLTGYGNVFADITSDSLVISTHEDNAFIQTGTGDDLITASGGGTNVLDDTGGAVNFEIGSAAGNNGFFLDASKDHVSWNTIANLHSGDFAVIYGVTSQNLTATAQDGLGATGYTGLTLETFQNGGAAFITLAGHSRADLGNTLATAFGTDPSGHSFLLVVAA